MPDRDDDGGRASGRREPNVARREARLLRLLLRLYPAAFRRELGEDLIRTSVERRRGEPGGWRSVARFWLLDAARFAYDGVVERAAAGARIGRDAVSALRQARRAPGFASLVVLTVGLGIGASSAMFTVADTAVFRPLPYPDPDRLFVVYARFGDLDLASHSLANFDALRAAAGLSWLAAARDRSPALTGHGDPERISVLETTEGYLDGLGARTTLGRLLQPPDFEAGAPAVAVISRALWQRRFDLDPGALGATLSLDGVPHVVVGVVGGRFRDPRPIETGGITAMWVPIRHDDAAWHRLDDYDHKVLARLAPGAEIAAARAEARRIGAVLAEEHPGANTLGEHALELSLEPLDELTVGPDARLRVLLVFSAGLLLLVLACANVANLLLARSATRRGELFVRTALGATRGRLFVQLMIESAVLSLLGGASGAAIAALALRSFRALAPPEIPRLHEMSLDPRGLLFLIVVSGLTGVAFGALPALRATHPRGAAHRASPGRGSLRAQSTLVAVQTALALMLVAGSALLLTSFRRLLERDPGFRPDGLVVIDVRAPGASRDTGRQRAFYGELLSRAQALPGVESAALSLTVPGRGGGARMRIATERTATDDDPAEFHRVNPVSEGYFTTLGTPLIEGRLMRRDEDLQELVINRAAARALFGDGDGVVGRRLALANSADAPLIEVVGLVGDVRQGGAASEPEPEVYVRTAHLHTVRQLLTLRLADGLPVPERAIRALVSELAPGTPIDGIQTMDELLSEAIAEQRFLASLVTAFGVLAMLLAALGAYSTASCAAAARMREMGIRQALGAARRSLVLGALSRSLTTTGVGIVVGLVLTAAGSRWLEGHLHDLSATDPATLVAACALLLSAAGVATLIPAVRVSRVDPARVLSADARG